MDWIRYVYKGTYNGFFIRASPVRTPTHSSFGVAAVGSCDGKTSTAQSWGALAGSVCAPASSNSKTSDSSAGVGNVGGDDAGTSVRMGTDGTEGCAASRSLTGEVGITSEDDGAVVAFSRVLSPTISVLETGSAGDGAREGLGGGARRIPGDADGESHNIGCDISGDSTGPGDSERASIDDVCDIGEPNSGMSSESTFSIFTLFFDSESSFDVPRFFLSLSFTLK